MRSTHLPEVQISPLMLTMPVAMGYIPLGIVFGFLFVQAGGAWWMAIAFSILVYAGAAQYMMIPMMAAGLSIGTIALATLVVNLRHVFYGLSLLAKLPHQGWRKWYMVYGLTDETYSVLTTLPENTPKGKLLSVALLNHCWWVTGTALGAIVGAQVKVPLLGLDFVLVCLFAVLMVEQWRSRESAMPLWLALISYPVALWLTAEHALVIAIGLCVMASVSLKTRSGADKNV